MLGQLMGDFRILLDEPVERPALGFDQYAQAFTEIIRGSEPRFAVGIFAVGIFGDRGSGKTTLMHAIRRRLDADETVVTLWFNAWRYEREAHLIVPLLDTLREALVDWAERPGRDRDRRDRVLAAATVARAARAILAGLSVTARLGRCPPARSSPSTRAGRSPTGARRRRRRPSSPARRTTPASGRCERRWPSSSSAAGSGSWCSSTTSTAACRRARRRFSSP
jgi:KAP family P-loop domain